jgi:serine protease Do
MREFTPSTVKKFVVITLAGSLVLGGATGGLVGLYAASALSGKPVSVQDVIKELAKGGSTEQRQESKNENVPAPAKPAAVDENSELADMVKKATPSVVSILISKQVAVQPVSDFFDFSPFGFNFGQPSDNSDNANSPKEKQQVGSGSGFIISADGLIVTNRHVVSDADATYTVVLSDGSKHDAKVLARDTVIDLALVKIEGKNLPALELGNSDSLELGQTVVAIGNALGQFSNSVTRGIVSGLNRRITAGDNFSGSSETIDAAIQTDAAINPGNSGGPLLTLDGKVVGVNTAVSSQGQSVGFAIPINVAKQSIESVRSTGRIVRPYLGIRYVLISDAMAKQNQLPVSYGALISRGNQPGQVAVIPGSPADKAGIMENDIILEADGTKIDTDHPITNIVVRKKVGDKVLLKVYHKGDTKTITVTLAEAPAS